MEGSEQIPGGAGFGSQTLGDITRDIMKFAPKLFHRFGENSQFVQEARASTEENMVQDAVPGSGALPRIALKEMRFQRLDVRKLTDGMPVVDDRLAG